MTVQIVFEPIRNRTQEVKTHCPSDFIQVMTLVFGDPPWTLIRGQEPILKAMGVVEEHHRNHGDDPNPYTQLLQAVGRYDEIEVTY